MKLARNMLTFIGYAASCEAMRLAEKAGLSLQQLGRVVRHTDLQSGGPGAVIVRENMDTLLPDNFLYGPMAHARDLGEKDLNLALALGDNVGADLPLAELALKSLAAGLGVPTRAHRPQRSSHGRTAQEGPREDRRGLRLGNGQYMPGEYFALTVDHLFGTIWSRPGYRCATGG